MAQRARERQGTDGGSPTVSSSVNQTVVPLAQRRVQAHPAVIMRDDPSDDGQPDPGALVLRANVSPEHLEDELAARGRDANALVPNAQPPACRLPAGPDLDPGPRVAGGQNLPKAAARRTTLGLEVQLPAQ